MSRKDISNNIFDAILFGMFTLAVIVGVTYAHNLGSIPQERNPEDLIHRRPRVRLNS